MLDLSVFISSIHKTNDPWWQRLRPRLTIIYLLVALALFILSVIGHVRLLGEIGKTFGGFFWAIDTDDQVVIASTLPQTGQFGASASSLTNTDHFIGVEVKHKHRVTVYPWQQNQLHAAIVPLTAATPHASRSD